MKILLTGSAGMIGRRIWNEALSCGQQVTVLIGDTHR